MKATLQDSLLFDLIHEEESRQKNTISLIASENYAPEAVKEAEKSVLMNKYAEGYPGKRYYAGCQVVDKIEQLAIDRAKALFEAEHANVQPHAGSQANFAIYNALLNPGDTILGMDLSSGGHLTHGSPVNLSGKLYKAIGYHVNPKTELLDFDEIQKLAEMHKPKLIIAGASAYSRIIDFQKFSEIARTIGAYVLADVSHIAGLIVAGLHPNPTPYADFVMTTTHKSLRGPRGAIILCKKKHQEHLDKSVMPGTQGGPFMHVIAAKAAAFHLATQPDFKIYQQQVIKNAQAMACVFDDLGYRIVTGGTDNHLFILDLRSKGVTGLEAERLLEKAGITVSRSTIPFDTQKPWITSGIRIGTPAMTTRGFYEQEAQQIALLIHEVLSQKTETAISNIRKKVLDLCGLAPHI